MLRLVWDAHSCPQLRGGGFVKDEELLEKKLKELPLEYCMALHGNHDEHQCHKKPGHGNRNPAFQAPDPHECYCGVWW